MVAHNNIITLTSWQYGFFLNFLWNVLYNIKITITRPLTRAHSLNNFVVSCNLDGRMSLDNKFHYIQLHYQLYMYIYYISVYCVIYITIYLCIRRITVSYNVAIYSIIIIIKHLAVKKTFSCYIYFIKYNKFLFSKKLFLLHVRMLHIILSYTVYLIIA